MDFKAMMKFFKARWAIELAKMEIMMANEAITIVLDPSGVVMTASEVEDFRQRRELGIKLS